MNKKQALDQKLIKFHFSQTALCCVVYENESNLIRIAELLLILFTIFKHDLITQESYTERTNDGWDEVEEKLI